MTPQELRRLLKANGSDRQPISSEDDDVQSRCRSLEHVLQTCQSLWATNSEELDLLAEELGNGSRDAAWRVPFGNSGILDFFLGLLADGRQLRPKLHIHALRLIGNSCADTNENRARMVQDGQLTVITQHVDNESLIPFNIPVIYNIIVDYEPAQALASRSLLSGQLIALLSKPSISNCAPFVPYICKILALLVSQDGEASVADPDTVGVLLSLANRPETKASIDDFSTIVTVAVAYLASERFQVRLITDDQVPLFTSTFHHALAEVNIDSIDDEDSVAQLKQLRASLLICLADISGNDAFASSYALADDIPQSFLFWMRTDNLSLQSAACLALGNLSRSDDASRALVETYKAHEPLVKLLSDPAITDSQLLHAACSFLKNLAIPATNKLLLSDLLLPNCIPRLYTLDTLPQIQFAAVSLTRQLLLNCPANVNAVTGASGAADRHTSVQDIIALFQRSDAEPTKLEAARCIAAICRVLHSPADEASVGFYATHAVAEPLRFLVTQRKWPSLRSEAWFVFALMSRAEQGAAVISSVLDDDAARGALAQTVTGQEAGASREGTEDVGALGSDAVAGTAATNLHLEPQQVDAQQQAHMAGVDAENALIMCTELIGAKEKGLAVPDSLAAILRRLVREGTKRVMDDRAARSD